MSARPRETEPELISPDEIHAQGGPSRSTQAKLRMTGANWIPYLIIGGEKRGRVMYRRADWKAYLAARLRQHTRDRPKSAAAPPTEVNDAAKRIVDVQPDPLEKLARPHRTA